MSYLLLRPLGDPDLDIIYYFFLFWWNNSSPFHIGGKCLRKLHQNARLSFRWKTFNHSNWSCLTNDYSNSTFTKKLLFISFVENFYATVDEDKKQTLNFCEFFFHFLQYFCCVLTNYVILCWEKNKQFYVVLLQKDYF